MLGMNRDEKLTRVPGLPPRPHKLNGRPALFPAEPSGGTWIGVNAAGVTFALVNWYAVASRGAEGNISRGAVVREMLPWRTSAEAGRRFPAMPLEAINPFRLIGVFPRERTVFEWRWDLSQLRREEQGWQSNIWISSGFDEPGAQVSRRAAFEAAARGTGLEHLDDLRKLHCSHQSGPGPYSVCMHRPDAATVSYTEVVVNPDGAQMSHASGPLCRHPIQFHGRLAILPGASARRG